MNMSFIQLNGAEITGRLLLEAYEAYCKHYKVSPNEDIEWRLGNRIPQQVLQFPGKDVELTNNFAPWQRFCVGNYVTHIHLQGINHDLSPAKHRKAGMMYETELEFIVEKVRRAQ